MPTLGQALHALAKSDAGFSIESPDGWTTGRTVYGGMTAALAAKAAELQFPDLPPLRSAQFTFVGPASGDLNFRVDLLRQGSSSSVVSVDCLAQGNLASRSIFTFGAGRESAVSHDHVQMPEAKPLEMCEPFMAKPPAAGFFQYFEHRLAGGARPFTADALPETLVWVRLLDSAGTDSQSALLAIADAVPPAAMIVFPSPGSISTMTWGMDFTQPLEITEWLLVHSKSEKANEGYSQQVMTVWNQLGERVGVARQTVAVFV